jgi:hypothetical protein
MPAVINSAPDCITHGEGPADDADDFILQANFEDCAGFGTFMPGSTYGEEGAAAETAYYILIWLGALVVVAVLVAWVVVENRRLVAYAARTAIGRGEPPPPGPGTTTP